MRTLLAFTAAFVALVGSAAAGHAGRAAVSATGQAKIYVTSTFAGTGRKGALYVLDESGQRSLLTDFGAPPLPGRKKQPDGKYVSSVAVEQDGTIVVVDRQAGGQGELFAVDPNTGDRRVLSDFGDKNQGPKGKSPLDVATTPDGRILVTVSDEGGGSCAGRCGVIVTVDPVTGQRSVLSDFGDSAQGPVAQIFGGLTVDAFGRIYVGVATPGNFGGVTAVAVAKVDATTGQRTVAAALGDEGAVLALAAQSDGSVLATACCTDLLRIDPVSHKFTLLSDLEDPALGPPCCSIDANSMALVTGPPSPTLTDGTVLLGAASLLKLDQATRVRTGSE
jgi:outer membrane protein assembly factor BamB